MSVKDTLNKPDLFRQQCYIAGRWCDADSGETLAVNNPATGEQLGEVPLMGDAETRRAIEAAAQALPKWRAKTAGERSIILRKWFELMLQHKEDLARIMTLEQGKPLLEAQGEILYAASFIQWFAEEARRSYGDTIPGHQADKRLMVIRQPVGVTAAITPWNFPAAMFTRKAGPALAAGCTMVLKPASQTPFSAFAVIALAIEAGVPPGVLSVVTGEASVIAGELTGNPLVRKLSFTGSTEIGSKLMAASAEHIKRISLELGGNAPLIVFDDASMDAAVEGTIACKFRNNGQTCVSANRIYVQNGIYDAFQKRLVEAVGRLKVGNGLDKGVELGPLIDDRAVRKVKEHVADALEKGAKLALGGKPHDAGELFFEPTVLLDVPNSARLTCEETFGPVAPLLRFEDEEEAIRLANDTEFGLASYLFTTNLSRAFRVSEALEYGMVGVNTGAISTAAAPFGGMKSSGLGREGSHYGMDEYTELKYVCMAIEQ